MPEDLLNKYLKPDKRRKGTCPNCGKGMYKNGDGDVRCVNCEYPNEWDKK